MTRRGDDRSEDAPDFGDRLQELKAQGCTVLVVGDAPPDVHAEVGRRLLGDGTASRRRLLVLTNGTARLETRLPEEAPGDDTEVVRASTVRSAAAEPGTAVGIEAVELADPSLAELGEAIVDAGERLERRHGPFEPAEFRFGLDSVSPLLDAHGEPGVFEFLTLLSGYVRSRDGLGHVHLPVERGDQVVRRLKPPFDALVEVRAVAGRHEQRWHVDDGSVTSRWLPV